MKLTREKQQLEVAEKLYEAITQLPAQQFTPQTIIDACKNSRVWLLQTYPKEETISEQGTC